MKEKNNPNFSIKEFRNRRTLIAFAIIVGVSIYLWTFAYAVYFIIKDEVFKDNYLVVLQYVRLGIYLLTLITLGLLITTIVYDGKQMKISSKDSILNFSASLIAASIILFFSAIQLVNLLEWLLLGSLQREAINVKPIFVVLGSLLWCASYNNVALKSSLTDEQKTSKSIIGWISILFGISIMPYLYGISHFWLDEYFKKIYTKNLYYLSTSMFQAICIAIIIKLITICFSKQIDKTKGIITQSILLVFALICTIFVIKGPSIVVESEIDIAVHASLLSISSTYMILMPIVMLCLNKKEGQK